MGTRDEMMSMLHYYIQKFSNENLLILFLSLSGQIQCELLSNSECKASML